MKRGVVHDYRMPFGYCRKSAQNTAAAVQPNFPAYSLRKASGLSAAACLKASLSIFLLRSRLTGIS
jgi:hypothetical protein